MKAQVGPVSKELKSLADTEAFLAKSEVGVVYFGEGSLKSKWNRIYLSMEIAWH